MHLVYNLSQLPNEQNIMNTILINE